MLEDFILGAAGMVIAAGTFRGGHLMRDEPAGISAGERSARRRAVR